MKLLFTFIIAICFCASTYSQKTMPDTSSSCSKIITMLSYYWKLDSLANNGFRLYAYKNILHCKVDKVTRAFLFDKLGRPNKTWKTNKGVDYLYYYYDSKAMPKEFGLPLDCAYISFRFDQYEKYLLSIDEGDIDY